MASFKLVQTAILLSLILIARGLYEDQVGTYDWKQDYVGKVKMVDWEPQQGGGKKMYLSTDHNILTSLNVHDGTIAWRQVAEQNDRGKIDAQFYNGNYIITVQAGGMVVRSWHAPTGNLFWETYLRSQENMTAPALFLNSEKELIMVAASESLACIKTVDGKVHWETNLPDGDTVQRWYLSLHDSGDILVVGATPGVRVTVVIMEPGGKVKRTYRVPAQWVQTDTSCLAVRGEAFVCYTPDTASLQFLSVPDSPIFKAVPLLEELGVNASKDSRLEAAASLPGEACPWFFLRVSRTNMMLMSVQAQEMHIVKDLNKVEAADIAYEGDSKVLLTVQRADPENVEFTGLDLTTMAEQTDISQRIHLLELHGSVEKIFPLLFTKKKDGKLGGKALLLAQDFSLHCAHKLGKTPWRREEALAYILSVEMVDLPVSENEAKFEDEFGSSQDDVLTMFVKRIKVQVLQLQGFIESSIQKILGHRHHHLVISKTDAGDVDTEDSNDDIDDELVRDVFSLHKMIVAVTAAGKVFGIRSHTGKVAWQHYFPDLGLFMGQGQGKLLLFVQRTTAHFPHPPQCAVLGVSKTTGNGLIVAFNPVTGAMLKDLPTSGLDLGFKVMQAQLVYDFPDDEFLKGIVMVDPDVRVHFFPESFRSVAHRQETGMFLHLTNPQTGLMNGYWLLNSGHDVIAENVWTVDLQGSQQRVTGVYSKRPIEHVHSLGRVLGDRSVLYKYLNPNLVVVIAEGEEMVSSATTKGPARFFNLYLVDAVTGHMVFHENHKRTHGPVSVVHAENWVVYSFYSDKHRRWEMAVLELYEGKEQSNSTAFSSLNLPHDPLVMRQSYIISQPIDCMASTVTEKGITSKNIIMALKIGGLLSLPKALLDPRRPSIPTPETMEEGTIPYVPELPVHTENYINYNLTMFNVRGIHTAPAGLESTSLVLVYGYDIFYTRVMPSKMFDVLKEDFDYLFISGVLAIMILVSIISQKLAARKALNKAWQ